MKRFYTQIIENPDGGAERILGHFESPYNLVEIPEDHPMRANSAAWMFLDRQFVRRPRLVISGPVDGAIAGVPFPIAYTENHDPDGPRLALPARMQLEARMTGGMPDTCRWAPGGTANLRSPGQYMLQVKGPWPWESNKITIEVAEAPAEAEEDTTDDQ